MSNILNSEDFGLKIYNRFPPKYREDDVGQNFALKRYLQSLSDGGFKHSIDEINGITHLIDPDKVDAKVLPVLFKQYGLDVFNGIPEEYLRYLLPKLGEAWAKKGSLNIIEFITTALSGTKSTTEVNYDEQDNPMIDIKLEMDYSLSDFVPDVEQFTRLLQNFVPFYCDMNLIYSYLFYENLVLRTRDNNLVTNITEKRVEKGLIPFTVGIRPYPQVNLLDDRVLNENFILNEMFETEIDPDYHEDTIKYNVIESSGLTRERSNEYYKKILGIRATNSTLILNEHIETDWLLDNIRFPLIKEQLQFRGSETLKERTSLTYNESVNMSRRGVPTTDTSAVLGIAVLGKAVLSHSEDNSDIFEDSVSQAMVDTGSLLQPVDTYINREYNVLNGTFFTNGGVHSYDIITIGGEQTIITH